MNVKHVILVVLPFLSIEPAFKKKLGQVPLGDATYQIALF